MFLSEYHYNQAAWRMEGKAFCKWGGKEELRILEHIPVLILYTCCDNDISDKCQNQLKEIYCYTSLQ